MGRPKLENPTKQIGIRLPIDLWDRVNVVAAAAGKRPGGYVCALLEEAVARDERALADRLEARTAVRKPVARRTR